MGQTSKRQVSLAVTTPGEKAPVDASPTEHPAMARYHQHLFELYRAKTDAFEKSVVTIAGGTLLLSVGFIEKIAGRAPHWTWLLAVGWLFLGMSLFAIMLAIRLSANAVFEVTQGYPWLAAEGDPGAPAARRIDWASYAAIGSLALGIALVVLFVYLNLWRQ